MRPQVPFRRPSLGLALSGGGIRGVAHIGVLQVLEGAGIRPDIITGTSAGSIIAGFYAYGICADEMENFALKTDPRQVFDLILSPRVALLMVIKIICDGFRIPIERLRDVPAGIADNQRLARLVRDYTRGASFDSLKLPCAIMATDINSGERVAFMSKRWVPRAILPKPTVYITDAPVYIAVKASTAIPGVFLPVKVNGRTLVDGGVTDYVPTEIAKAMGADVVVAVDLGYVGGEKEPVDNILEVVTQSIDIMGRELADLRLASSATVGVFPKVGDVGLLDFDRIPECIERGREAARSALPDIEKALSYSRGDGGRI